ncbi:MAG: nitrous oxide-stimulated promoter family protein [Eggerthellaceae bacterium]|nr:nitrous oxide-stimulated promoter family protein [Eggerthellaceae bacterium]
MQAGQQGSQRLQQQSDTPSVARRREREMRTISQMVALFCAANHASDARVERAHCGERVCSECARLDAYAVMRTRRCRKMDAKISCEKCENHCYRSDERERIRAVMRFSGPRMLTKHPVAAVRHLLGK